MKKVVLAALVLWMVGLVIVGMLVKDEIKRQEASTVLFARGQSQGCLRCHEGIEEVHPKAPLHCTACHNGDPKAKVKTVAHKDMHTNPADLNVADHTCGLCHKTIVDRVKRSVMATRAGSFSGTFFLNGFQDDKETPRFTFSNHEVKALPHMGPRPAGTTDRLLPFPTYAATQNVFVDLMRKECMQCLYGPKE